MSELPSIENAHLVEAVFGYFPVFHDGEVVKLICDRGEPNIGGPTVELLIHGWESTSTATDNGLVA